MVHSLWDLCFRVLEIQWHNNQNCLFQLPKVPQDKLWLYFSMFGFCSLTVTWTYTRKILKEYFCFNVFSRASSPLIIINVLLWYIREQKQHFTRCFCHKISWKYIFQSRERNEKNKMKIGTKTAQYNWWCVDIHKAYSFLSIKSA